MSLTKAEFELRVVEALEASAGVDQEAVIAAVLAAVLASTEIVTALAAIDDHEDRIVVLENA